MNGWRFRTVLAGVLVAAAVLSGWAAATRGQKLEKLILAYSSTVPGSDSTFLFAGKQLGFFKEQGVDLDIQTTGGTVGASGFIASGVMEVALGGLEAMPGYVLQGVPMRAVYVYANRPIFSLGFLKGSKVQKVSDLKGARVGVLGPASGSVPVLQYTLKEAGLGLGDVTLVPLGMGPATMAAIKKGEVDVITYHDSAFVNFIAQGLEVTLYSSPKLQQGYAGQGIYALEKTLNARKPVVEGFLRGLTKSLVYAMKNPQGATRAFGLLHPEAAKNPGLEEAMWRERMKICVLPPEAKGQWGYTDRTAWDNMLDVLVIGGVIKDRPPVDKLYTTAFLKAANEVDTSKLP